MTSAYSARTDDVRTHAISPALRRVLVFALLGPALGVLAAFFVAAVSNGGQPVVLLAYLFSLVICAIAGPVDGLAARAVPVSRRAPLTAVVGAAVAVGLSVLVGAIIGCGGAPSLLSQIPVAIIGALSTGTCSLLAHDHRRQGS